MLRYDDEGNAFIEKYIDTNTIDFEYEINKHISFGWYIYYKGLTFYGLRKYI